MFATFNNRLAEVAEGPPTKKRRSKMGCSTCRRRKKKCDEMRPQCNYCKLRGLVCEWGIKQVEVGDITKKHTKGVDPTTHEKEENVCTPAEMPPEDDLSCRNPISSQTSSAMVTTSHPQISDIYSFQSVYSPSQTLDFDYTLFGMPLLNFNLYLDETGVEYLHYFERKVAPLISLLPAGSNYFLKTFFAAANDHEAISQAIAAWGALFRDGNSEVVTNYLDRAKEVLLRHNTLDGDANSLFLQFAFYLITMGIQVCLGDVDHWYGLFDQCVKILQRVGGINKFLERFNFTNDAKFLVANFQIHDIMLSTTTTVCNIHNYSNMVRMLEYDLEDYGIDPFQGCLQPLYLLLGEMTNVYDDLKATRDDFTKRIDSEDVTLDRINYYVSVDQHYNSLVYRVINSKPLNNLGNLPNDERRAHIKLFEVYRIVCKLYLLLYFKQVSPLACEVQQLLLTMVTSMETLAVRPRMVLSLNYALIIAGVASTTYDRARVQRLVDTVYDNYSLGNVMRVRELIKEVWRRNANGHEIIDWMAVCREFGWKLSVC